MALDCCAKCGRIRAAQYLYRCNADGMTFEHFYRINDITHFRAAIYDKPWSISKLNNPRELWIFEQVLCYDCVSHHFFGKRNTLEDYRNRKFYTVYNDREDKIFTVSIEGDIVSASHAI